MSVIVARSVHAARVGRFPPQRHLEFDRPALRVEEEEDLYPPADGVPVGADHRSPAQFSSKTFE